MNAHRTVRLLLYDYVRGTLDGEESRMVERHIADCPGCASEAASHRDLLRTLPAPAAKPSDALPDSYWTGFANEVMGKVDDAPAKRPGFIGRLLGRRPFGGQPVGRRPFGGRDAGLDAIGVFGGLGLLGWIRTPGGQVATGLAAAAAVAVVAWVLLLPPGAGRPDQSTGPATADQAAVVPADDGTTDAADDAADSLAGFDRRLSDYFRKSKTLLVGVSNTAPAKGEELDLDAERQTSRSLLREARYLRSGPVDPQASRLIDDLDRILIGLANGEAAASGPDVRMLRGGIERGNLLFKLRMQETRNQRLPVQQASYHR